MKIGIDGHNLEGKPTGVGRYLLNILREWDQQDLPVDLEFILYFKSEIPKDLNLSDKFQKKLLKVSSQALFMHSSLCRQAAQDKLDWLFCPGYLAPLFYRGKIALTLHDIIYQARPDLYNWPSWKDKILLKLFSKISAKKADLIFVPSEYTKQEVLKHYQVDLNKIKITLEAADVKKVIDQKKIAAFKQKYQIQDKFILYIGSIFNRRHLPETIRAFEQIVKQLKDYQFLMIGKNHTAPKQDIRGIIEQVNQNLNKEAVLWIDYLPEKEISLAYSAAEALIWLSDYEGFGLPVLEAITCQIPVITSPITSIPEVAGKAALYVQESNNIQEIKEAILSVLTNQKIKDELLANARIQANKFSWQKCAKETLDALLGIG